MSESGEAALIAAIELMGSLRFISLRQSSGMLGTKESSLRVLPVLRHSQSGPVNHSRHSGSAEALIPREGMSEWVLLPRTMMPMIWMDKISDGCHPIVDELFSLVLDPPDPVHRGLPVSETDKVI